MKVIKDWPPNIEEIRKHFEVDEGVCFTYGDTVYSPGGGSFPGHLVDHEETHMRQQAAAGGPEVWWKRYLEDVDFRLSQEVEAYGNQVRWFRKNDKKKWKWAISKLSEDLAGPIYGRSISFPQAYQRILAASA